MKPLEVIVRQYDPKKDDPYIYSTWVRYSWHSPLEPHKVSKQQYFKDKAEEIKEILTIADVNIACLKTGTFFILGYIVVKDGEVVWTCVKKSYHGQGIDQLLL